MITDLITVTAGSVFAVSGRTGDFHPGTPEGFYAYDTRFLSNLKLTVEGKEPEGIGASQINHSLASFYASSLGVKRLRAGVIGIVRDRYVSSRGFHEDVTLSNYSAHRRSIELKFAFDADFADVFEVRVTPVHKAGSTSVEQREGAHLCLVYQIEGLHRETWITFSRDPIVLGRTASFQVELEPKATWKTCLSVVAVLEGIPQPMRCVEAALGPPLEPYRRRPVVDLSVLREVQHPPPLADPPKLETKNENVSRAFQQAVYDLRSLLIEHRSGNFILAAGMPWFMTIFGRDSIIAAIETKLLGPELMLGTLRILGQLQATKEDLFREAEPGKIIHELREGELSILERVPHSRYYGTVDATPLFLVLLWEAYQWTGDKALLEEMLPAAEAALRWIDNYGDMDGDGFVEYHRRSRRGLRNQGWKDSGDSVHFADGRLAEGPIALAEVQGYVYDGKQKMAQIYRILGNPNRARELEQQAKRLQDDFEAAFWMPDEGFVAIALDKRKRKANSIASNAGHCLWSGILRNDKAAQVVERLIAPDMFSGWGVRTLSTEMMRYHPVSYHNGSVWPHDTAIIAGGMARYGFTKQASQVALALMDAAAAFPRSQLPELFAGYPRREYSFPVPYPAANAPQAWAAGAVIYMLETLLGAYPEGERLLQEAPFEGLDITLRGVPYRGTRRAL